MIVRAKTNLRAICSSMLLLYCKKIITYGKSEFKKDHVANICSKLRLYDAYLMFLISIVLFLLRPRLVAGFGIGIGLFCGISPANSISVVWLC